MRTTVLALALMVSLGTAAEARQTVSALGDLWMNVKSRDRIFVTDGSGRETGGVFAKVSDSAVTLLVDGHFIKGRSVILRVPSTTARISPRLSIARREIGLSVVVPVR